ncbi:MAG: hypothetical protein KC464_27485 [Myxococcales bacterium]|nr:hypothetical protein [Myxococcales bacterium]
MARPSLELVVALRTTAARLEAGAAYQWGHLGQCNCGHLVQTVCRAEPRTIHAWALERQCDDWGDLANEYCPTSGHHIDDVIATLLALGLTRGDLWHLERLDDEAILATLPGGRRWLRRNDRADAVAYLRAWASKLEAELPAAAAAAAAA